MVVGRANSEGDINVDSEEDSETSELLSKIVTHSESTTRSSPYQKNQPIATMLPPYYNNHGLLQQQASDLSQQSHSILSLSQQSQALSQTLNNSLHQIHQRSSSQNSQDSGEHLNNHHNHINDSISNHHKNINHPESNESCNSEGDSESLTSNVQDEKDIIDQECDTKNDVLSSKDDNKKEPGELPEEVYIQFFLIFLFKCPRIPYFLN